MNKEIKASTIKKWRIVMVVFLVVWFLTLITLLVLNLTDIVIPGQALLQVGIVPVYTIGGIIPLFRKNIKKD